VCKSYQLDKIMVNMPSKLLKTIFIIISILFLLFISKKYYDQATSFAFVDEYDNIAVAHQMIKGKKLFSEVFHNRQIGPVYLSYAIQLITKPQTLYQLIAVHRLFIIAISFIFSILLLFRFGLLGLGFPILFEPIKYYFHGNLFLGESMIVYPIIYLVLLLFEKNKKPSSFSLYIKPAIKFAKDYFLKLGFLDGYYGFVICKLAAYSKYLKYYKAKNKFEI